MGYLGGCSQKWAHFNWVPLGVPLNGVPWRAQLEWVPWRRSAFGCLSNGSPGLGPQQGDPCCGSLEGKPLLFPVGGPIAWVL